MYSNSSSVSYKKCTACNTAVQTYSQALNSLLMPLWAYSEDKQKAPISRRLAARKSARSSTLATLRKTRQVAGAAGSRDQHKPLMLFHLKIKPRKPLVLIFAGRICANRPKPAFHLILLSRAIVQFSYVLPSRFRSQIF